MSEVPFSRPYVRMECVGGPMDGYSRAMVLPGRHNTRVSFPARNGRAQWVSASDELSSVLIGIWDYDIDWGSPFGMIEIRFDTPREVVDMMTRELPPLMLRW